MELINGVAARVDLSPLGRLRLYIERQVLFNIRNIELITLYYRDVDLLPEVRRKSIIKGREAFEKFVSRLIAEAVKAGQVSDGVDIASLTYCVYATINFIYTWYRPRREVKPEDLAVRFAEFALAGIVGSGHASETQTV
jgi:TetR/AcrR family transcriptional regulator, cholesterol catabolism regulator